MGGVRCLGLFPKKKLLFFGCLPKGKSKEIPDQSPPSSLQHICIVWLSFLSDAPKQKLSETVRCQLVGTFGQVQFIAKLHNWRNIWSEYRDNTEKDHTWHLIVYNCIKKWCHHGFLITPWQDHTWVSIEGKVKKTRIDITNWPRSISLPITQVLSSQVWSGALARVWSLLQSMRMVCGGGGAGGQKISRVSCSCYVAGRPIPAPTPFQQGGCVCPSPIISLITNLSTGNVCDDDDILARPAPFQ